LLRKEIKMTKRVSFSVKISLLVLIIVVLAIFPCCIESPQKIVLVGGTLLDVSNGGCSTKDIKDSVIIIEDDKIVSVGQKGEVQIPKDAQVIDVTGKFIVPGLIDGFAALKNQDYANAYLYMGVTSIVGVGAYQRAPLFTSADPSPTVYRLEGLGHEEKCTDEELLEDIEQYAGQGVKIFQLLYKLIPGQVQLAVNKAHELEIGTNGELGYCSYVDAIKAGVDAFIHTGRYTLDVASEELRKAIAENPFGPVMEEYREFLTNLNVSEDQKLKEHAERLGSSDTYLMPTLSLQYLDLPNSKNPWDETVAQILDPADIHDPADLETGKHDYDEETQIARTNLALNILNIERLYKESGSKYLAGSGTDKFGTMPGISLHTELELLHRIGLTNREILAAATSNFAIAYGWKNVGQIKSGCVADILVLDKNPLEDLENLKEIHTLILRGEVIDRDGLLNLQNGKLINSKLVYSDEQIEIHDITYLSDGLKVKGYIAQPKSDGKHPVIIWNRGGNREFGLLEPNKLEPYAHHDYIAVGSQYRGNGGSEGREEFGGSDVNDVLNLIPLIRSLPNANPDKIGMIGYSRGGMMTYIALKEQTLRGTDDIKVACTIGGLADLFMSVEERPDMVNNVYIPLIGGDPGQIPEQYKARSAVYWADKINVPLLIQHGEADWRVSVDQARKLARELDSYNKEYKLITYPGDDHGLTSHDRGLPEIFTWLDKYLE
jgi:dienelactone hydrolase